MKPLWNLLFFVFVAVMLFVTVYGAIPVLLWIGAIFFGAGARAERALARVTETLMGGETLIESGIQHRMFALFHRRHVIAITSSRVLLFRRGLLGGYNMQDIQWKDLDDVILEENVLPALCGANLIFKHLNPRVRLIEALGIDTAIAPAIYARAQHEEQAWEEKRRMRNIEEVRAAAGGVTVNTGVPGAAVASVGNRTLEEIRKAKELLDLGAISDAEYEEMKARILSQVA